MARTKKKGLAGPTIEDGVRYVVIPATKRSLSKVMEESCAGYELVSISPQQFNGKEFGIKYLESCSDKWSGRFCPYVSIRDVDSLKTPKIEELRRRIASEEKLLKGLIERSDVSSFKAKLVTCSSCESKVNKNYINGSRCPVCDSSLRSKSATASIHIKEDKLVRLRAKLNSECIKHAGEASLKYLVVVPDSER